MLRAGPTRVASTVRCRSIHHDTAARRSRSALLQLFSSTDVLYSTPPRMLLSAADKCCFIQRRPTELIQFRRPWEWRLCGDGCRPSHLARRRRRRVPLRRRRVGLAGRRQAGCGRPWRRQDRAPTCWRGSTVSSVVSETTDGEWRMPNFDDSTAKLWVLYTARVSYSKA